MTGTPAAECFRCGAPATERLGRSYICEGCVPDDVPEDGTAAVDANPSPDADESPLPDNRPAEDVLAGQDALADAIRWFHAQLDRQIVDHTDEGGHADRPTTAREYWEDGRGLDAETVDGKLLGWAPPDARDQLLDHLLGCGHDREAILATGLFTDDLDLLWRGRYVLPYFDESGRVVYAISRTTGSKGGGAVGYDGHPRDVMSGKYAKLAHTKEYVDVDEPIYGLASLDPGEDVIITEGILDAITAHEAGYACLSPVTTQFKHRHREALLKILDERDLGTVYVVQDAEAPTSDLVEDTEGWDSLTVEQFGEGLKGGATTAGYLSDNGVDARLAELPRPGLDKVDLDDYLGGWADTLAPVLASAGPPEQHPAYDPQRMAIEGARQQAEAAEKRGADGDSALFDLDLVDVAPVSGGYRGKNPLGHHGKSENYYVVLDGGELGYDHKHKAAYNALTHLLCKAGERRARSPSGPLDDSELLAAWVQAKRDGHLTDDDPIPHAALRHFATDRGLCERDALIDGWRLPRCAYNESLQRVEEEYGVDPGRALLPDREPAAALPIGHLDALSAEERRRYAAKRGLEWPDTDEARERLRNALVRELRAGNSTVLDAPTALGKSYTVATEPWRRHADITGEAPVVHLHATRDARDEAAGHTEASSAAGAVLRGRGECCPLAAGDHDPVGDPESEAAPDVPVTVNGLSASEHFDLLCDEKGLPFSTAHALAREYNDQGLEELPCREDGECEAIAQWEGVPRDDEGNPSVDVVHATHQFAYVPSLRRHTNVVLDEQPDYSVDLGQDRIRRMVNAYLREIGAPVTTWEDFVSLAKHWGHGGDAAAERDALDDMVGIDPGREWFVEDADAHALAPDLTRALWNAFRWEEPDENGRRSTKVMHEPPRLDADLDGYASTWLSVVVDEENTVRSVRNVPDFSQSRSVVGLDAHPSMPMWELNAGPTLTRDAVLEPEERRLWRRYERGLTVVQVGDATRPRSGSKALEWMNRDRVAAVVERIREHATGDLTTAIAPQQVETAVGSILAADGVDAETMHYGEEKSRNDFADEPVGYLYGCMDPGDEMILDALAELDLNAQPATAETEDGETVREKGRTFVGPDVDVAEAVLASVRENHVAQGAGRYARNPSDPDSGAVVYLHTDAAPPGFVDVEAPGVEWQATDTQQAIVDVLTDRPSVTTREIADAVGCSKEHARGTLCHLEERDVVCRRHQAGDHGADVYRDTGSEGAIVNLGGTTNAALEEHSRWSLAILDGFRNLSDYSGRGADLPSLRAVLGGGEIDVKLPG